MFGLNILQALLIIVYVGCHSFDYHGPQTMVFSTILSGVVIGAICGDASTGLYIGATLQLMSLGVVGLGGASVPNYFLTTVITTIVAIQTGAGYEIGMTIGLPVGMMAVYLDVLVKTVGGPIQQYGQKLVEEGQFDKGVRVSLITLVLNVLQEVLPVVVILFCGQAVTELIVNAMPDWLYGGLTVAGKLLPVTGMAILMNYMPVKKHFAYMILGFVMYSYVKLPILCISLVGVALAVIYYQREMDKVNGAVAGGLEDE